MDDSACLEMNFENDLVADEVDADTTIIYNVCDLEPKDETVVCTDEGELNSSLCNIDFDPR